MRGGASGDGLSIRSTALANFANGFPQFCVSITYESRGRLELGICTKRSSAYFSSRRAAAARGSTDGRSVSATRSLDRTLLATAFPYDSASGAVSIDLLGGLHDAHAGSAAYGFRRAGPLRCVACGRVDACGNSGCGRGTSQRAR